MGEDLATGAVWALTGPTATGKSALAVACAKAVGGEIIGCDSVQLYRGFELASAKPEPELRAQVPHHLIDCADWQAPWDAARWVAQARACVADVRRRGRVPLLCGGTGLYLQALQHGLIDVPSEPALRQRLAAAMAADPAGTYQQLQAADPQGARVIAPQNPAYVIRALEICLLTGRPASVVRAEQAARAAADPRNLAVRTVALDGDNPWLRARVVARSGQMVAAGLVDEVAGLLARGVDPACAPMRSVGYREAVQVVQGERPAAELAAAVDRASWAYIRRQRTWLRRCPPAVTLAAEATPTALRNAALAAWRAGGG